MESNQKRRLIWVAIVFVILLVLGMFTFRAFDSVRVARTGSDLGTTYLVYHAGLLGEVKFGGCTVDMKEPWLPRLKSYETLSIVSDELILIDFKAPTMGEKYQSISLLRNSFNFDQTLLQASEKIGENSVQFIDAEVTKAKIPTLAWLPQSRLYVAGRTQEKVREALKSLKIACK